MARHNSHGTILPYGHSNVRANETEQDTDDFAHDLAQIPLVSEGRGGRSKKVPPLALSRAEWVVIGQKMRWLSGDSLRRE